MKSAMSNSARPQNGVGIPTPFWGRAELDIADFIAFLLFSAEKVLAVLKDAVEKIVPN